MQTPVYIKLDASEPLLLSEGVCRQLGILCYNPDVTGQRDRGDTRVRSPSNDSLGILDEYTTQGSNPQGKYRVPVPMPNKNNRMVNQNKFGGDASQGKYGRAENWSQVSGEEDLSQGSGMKDQTEASQDENLSQTSMAKNQLCQSRASRVMDQASRPGTEWTGQEEEDPQVVDLNARSIGESQYPRDSSSEQAECFQVGVTKCEENRTDKASFSVHLVKSAQLLPMESKYVAVTV